VADPIDQGYVKGVGKEARFRIIGGFLQLNTSAVMISDLVNNCLRLLNRETLSTSVFVGLCTAGGYRDGLNARLNGPSAVIELLNSDALLLAD
jgi:hypothetical protein